MCCAMVRAAKSRQIVSIVAATLRTQRNVMNVEKPRGCDNQGRRTARDRDAARLCASRVRRFASPERPRGARTRAAPTWARSSSALLELFNGPRKSASVSGRHFRSEETWRRASGWPGEEGPSPGLLPATSAFQLVHRLATCHVQPGGLGLRDRHARELARSGPVQHAGIRRSSRTRGAHARPTAARRETSSLLPRPPRRARRPGATALRAPAPTHFSRRNRRSLRCFFPPFPRTNTQIFQPPYLNRRSRAQSFK